MDNVKVILKEEDFKKICKRFEKLNINIQDSVIKRKKKLKKDTKEQVKTALKPHHGVDKGIYKRSIIAKDLSEYDTDLSFQVGAGNGHHRLTHLIENGHRIKVNGGFTGKKTRSFPHIKPGQDYVDQKAVSIFEEAIKEAIKKED